VQLQLLTAIVKLFLKKPTDTQELVQQVLTLATQVHYNFSRNILSLSLLHLYEATLLLLCPKISGTTTDKLV